MRTITELEAVLEQCKEDGLALGKEFNRHFRGIAELEIQRGENLEKVIKEIFSLRPDSPAVESLAATDAALARLDGPFKEFERENKTAALHQSELIMRLARILSTFGPAFKELEKIRKSQKQAQAQADAEEAQEAKA